MLGLRRHTVGLAQHDPTWAEAFESFASEVCTALDLPRARVQHVGSTSVPGLVAKPILDVAVGVLPTESIESVAAGLVALGLIDRGYQGEGVGHFLVREPVPNLRSVHVHIVPFESESWQKDIRFRDRLRTDPDLRRRYGECKTRLAALFPDNRAAYRQEKDKFFMELEAEEG